MATTIEIRGDEGHGGLLELGDVSSAVRDAIERQRSSGLTDGYVDLGYRVDYYRWVAVYSTEEEARAAAEAREESGWNQEVEHGRYYACRANLADDRWVVRERPLMPGTCT